MREQIVLAEEATMNSNEEQKDLGRSIAEYERWCEAYNLSDSDEVFDLFLSVGTEPELGVDLSEPFDYDRENSAVLSDARKAYFAGLGWNVS